MKELNIMENEDNNIFKHNYFRYTTKNISVIPDKFMKKQPAIKSWSDYCYKLPDNKELVSWSNNFEESNIAVCLGQSSKIIALDIDAESEDILKVILPILPESPIEKIGAKGMTRFFKYTGETTDILKFNGEVVAEILSNGKKTTIPPSIHPNGESYRWTGKALYEVNVDELPMLPPALFSHLSSRLRLAFPDAINQSYNKITSGRNATLSSLCGKLIGEGKSVDETIREMLKVDCEEHDPPLFTDPEEMRHTHAYTNALMFYSNHLASINTKRYRENKEYEIPAFQAVIDIEKIKEVRLGKLQREELQKKSKLPIPSPVNNVLGHIIQTILENSWVKQPELAFGASLTLISTLISRKLVFQGMSPNLYVLNISPSGSGKEAPQAFIKNALIDLRADSLLGSGDYVSDASLMNTLDIKPVRLDIMDEAGGILRNVNSGKSDYNGKMADILAELYTSSNSKYLGRSTAEGNKGSCYRPNVNILASTTPTGFSEGITLKAIEKGLMGRFLIFLGDAHATAERVHIFKKIKPWAMDHMRYWFGYQPDITDNEIGGVTQSYIELKADDYAEKKLDEYFTYFDNIRRNSDDKDPMLPIKARLYQQMVKLVMIHAAARTAFDIPVINTEDVEFGFKTINYYFENITEIVKRYIFENSNEKDTMKILNIIRDKGEVSKQFLFKNTASIKKRDRESIIADLLDSEIIIRDSRMVNGKPRTYYVYIGEEE